MRSSPDLASSVEDIELSAGLVTTEQLEQQDRLNALKHKLRSGAYTMGGVDWKAAFEKFDADGSGELDEEEFVAAMKTGGYAAALSSADLSVLFQTIDASQDGVIDADEFASFMRATSKVLMVTITSTSA